MYLEQLMYYTEVIRCGSISAAAKNLYISQSALSQSIANLENELGAKLIKRAYNGTRPTMFGDRLNDSVAETMSGLYGAIDGWKALISQSAELTGTVKLAADPDCCDFFATVIMEEMQSSYPNVVLYISQSMDMHFRLSAFEESEAGIGISSCACPHLDDIRRGAEARGYRFECFAREMPCVIVSVKNPLAEKGFVSLEDIRTLKAAIFSETPPPPFARYFGGIICQVSDVDALAGFISGNPGAAAMLSPSLVRRKTGPRWRSIKALAIEDGVHVNGIEEMCHFLIYRQPELLSPAEQRTLEVIKYHLKDYRAR